MTDPLSSRRLMMGAARRYLLDSLDRGRDEPVDEPPRLTPRALDQTRMSRSRDRILANLDEMYREAFERAKATGDSAQMATLDFTYPPDNPHFDIRPDVADALERR